MTYQPGRYPKDYNPKVHGPYYPHRFYGKPDTPFSEVKIADLGSWFSRRSLSPSSIWAAIHRGYYRWASKNLHTKVPGFAPYGQIIMLTSTYFFFLLYSERKYHRHCKYH
ncbi:putative ATP synthase subunit f, mitochondrial [Biomphalaria glabrata]|uniref:ATP synthase subunit f, mitochondrial n=2 Tax=Biomphalaria TaxID=6525 RepID=A0A2C9M3S4_BIOGL|nr:putative ATP synthase subunit f, mitochondrial [Biomphalaria glabrata]KAI8796460.1 ATP synthase subunit f, mitochondrial [Biomphalaria glabrata]KAK0043156.1 ATP synthase subunit f mitochondrial [Biomphalaria pfeifferi]